MIGIDGMTGDIQLNLYKNLQRHRRVSCAHTTSNTSPTMKFAPRNPPLKILEQIVSEVYLACLPQLNTATRECNKHICSPASPCRVARTILAPVLSLKLVASPWGTAVQNFQQSSREAFFSQVEDGVYYPYAWHINTRVRKVVLLARYRVFRTIHSDAGTSTLHMILNARLNSNPAGKRGVYLAYDLGGPDGCCANALEVVVVKAWVTASDLECQREMAAYSALSGAHPCRGVPVPRAAGPQHDSGCDVHALVLPKLGPTLQDLREVLPDRRFDARMVLTVAIQMVTIFLPLILVHIFDTRLCFRPADRTLPRHSRAGRRPQRDETGQHLPPATGCRRPRRYAVRNRLWVLHSPRYDLRITAPEWASN